VWMCQEPAGSVCSEARRARTASSAGVSVTAPPWGWSESKSCAWSGRVLAEKPKSTAEVMAANVRDTRKLLDER